jgi:hypothetical protein
MRPMARLLLSVPVSSPGREQHYVPPGRRNEHAIRFPDQASAASCIPPSPAAPEADVYADARPVSSVFFGCVSAYPVMRALCRVCLRRVLSPVLRDHSGGNKSGSLIVIEVVACFGASQSCACRRRVKPSHRRSPRPRLSHRGLCARCKPMSRTKASRRTASRPRRAARSHAGILHGLSRYCSTVNDCV